MRIQHPELRNRTSAELSRAFTAIAAAAGIVMTAACVVALSSYNQSYAGQEKVGVSDVARNVVVFSTTLGNVVASVGPDGAFLVGTPSAESTPEIARVLAARTPSMMRYVVIAPEDPARSEGDAGWARQGAFVSMQEKALERLGGHAMGPPLALPRRLADLHVDRPRVAFSEVLTADVNGEAIHVVHQPPAYSDADAIIHFHIANLVYLGEVFPGDGYPCVDKAQHGNFEGFIKILGAWTDAATIIVPAHGKVTTGAEVKQYRNMITTVRDRVKRLIDSGKTEKEIQAEHPTAEFDAKWGGGQLSPQAFVSEVYTALTPR